MLLVVEGDPKMGCYLVMVVVILKRNLVITSKMDAKPRLCLWRYRSQPPHHLRGSHDMGA